MRIVELGRADANVDAQDASLRVVSAGDRPEGAAYADGPCVRHVIADEIRCLWLRAQRLERARELIVHGGQDAGMRCRAVRLLRQPRDGNRERQEAGGEPNEAESMHRIRVGPPEFGLRSPRTSSPPSDAPADGSAFALVAFR